MSCDAVSTGNEVPDVSEERWEIKTVHFFDMSVNVYESTWRNISEDLNLQVIVDLLRDDEVVFLSINLHGLVCLCVHFLYPKDRHIQHE